MKRIYPQLIHIAFSFFVLSFAFSSFAVAKADAITPDTVVELVNRDRISQGVSPLTVNEALTHAAQAKADDMAKNDYFAHTSPSGVTPWHWIEQSGYDYRFAGENLAIHFTDARDQEKAWMESVKHRENLLNPKYQDIGVAVKETMRNGQSAIITVQMFGFPSGIVLSSVSERTISPIAQVQENTIIASARSLSLGSSQMMTTPEISPDHTATKVLLIEWIGLLIVMLIIGIGLKTILRSQKVPYFVWLHSDVFASHRG